MNKKDNKSPSTAVIIILVVLALSIIIFSLYSIKILDPGPKPSPEKTVLSYGNANIGGDFKLNSTLGSSFTPQNMLGKVSLIYFGFASCPDICPTTLQVMSIALNELNERELQQVLPIFVSVDHERDRKKEVKDFLADFHPKFVGLYGSEDEVKKMADQYKVFYSKVDPQDDDFKDVYLIDHTAIIYVMDKNGHYIKHFSSKVSSDEIVKELRKILD